MICHKCHKQRIPEGRSKLGYVTCLDCGESIAKERAEKRKKQVAPTYNKGAYQYITINDTKTIGR
jgi:ribosomal protein S26